MKPDYYPNGWLRKLDLAGMVLAPISMSSIFFIFAILLYQTAGSNGIKYYEAALLCFLGGIGMLIVFVPYFRDAIKSYVTYQATKDTIYTFRVAYFGLILTGLVVDFMIFVYILF